MIKPSPLNRLILHEYHKILDILSQTHCRAAWFYASGNTELADRYLELHQDYQEKIKLVQKGIFQ